MAKDVFRARAEAEYLAKNEAAQQNSWSEAESEDGEDGTTAHKNKVRSAHAPRCFKPAPGEADERVYQEMRVGECCRH